MKTILSLLANPSIASSGTIAIPIKLIHAITAIYLLLGSFAFQFLYPRLLDNLPMLGVLRKVQFWKNRSFFSPQLFSNGLLICGLILLVVFTVYTVTDWIKRKKVDVWKSYVVGIATIIPFLAWLVIGMILFPINPYLGLLPLFGLLVVCAVQGGVLRDSYDLGFILSCYLVPVLMGMQCYVFYLARP